MGTFTNVIFSGDPIVRFCVQISDFAISEIQCFRAHLELIKAFSSMLSEFLWHLPH